MTSARSAVFTLILTSLSATPVLACAVCFGDSNSLQFKGAQMGILAMLVVTGLMLTAFAAFFLHLRRRINATEGVN
jgi:hypothetical protein